MKIRALAMGLGLLLVTGITPVTASDGLISGLPRLACETILCLSTGSPPTECNPALNYFYSLDAKKWKDILKLRMNFLSLCPSSGEPGMPSLVAAIANGGGRCDNSLINRLNQIESQCGQTGEDFYNSTACGSTEIPRYCQVYANHAYTRIALPIKVKECERMTYYYDDGGSAPVGYLIERNQLCHYVWKKNPQDPFK